MKLHVITNAQGDVLGTHESGPSQAGAPVFGGFTASNDQKIHEIEVADGYFDIKDAGEFHKAVEKHIHKK